MNLAESLIEFAGEARRVVVLGIGSELCGDDSAGMLCASLLKKELALNDNFLVLSASTAPENFTGEICDFKPDALLMIDAAELGLAPGRITFIDPDNIKAISFSTHMLPLNMLVKYLQLSVKCPIAVLGVQYKNRSFGDSVCAEVQQAVGHIVDAVIALSEAIL